MRLVVVRLDDGRVALRRALDAVHLQPAADEDGRCLQQDALSRLVLAPGGDGGGDVTATRRPVALLTTRAANTYFNVKVRGA